MTFAEHYRDGLQQTLQTLDMAKVNEIIARMERAIAEGRTIFTCGNGGSAASASHFMCDMVKGASYQRDVRVRIMALTDNLATITAYSNDVSYDCVFAEQLKNFAQPGDVVLAISGSGNSPNVLNAIQTANELGCETIGLAGRDGGKLAPLAKLSLVVPEQHMGRIEDAHMIVCHMIAYHFMEHPVTKAAQA